VLIVVVVVVQRDTNSIPCVCVWRRTAERGHCRSPFSLVVTGDWWTDDGRSLPPRSKRFSYLLDLKGFRIFLILILDPKGFRISKRFSYLPYLPPKFIRWIFHLNMKMARSASLNNQATHNSTQHTRRQ
jgi:hypothetical protein